jgi:hypothetical protein
VPECSTTSPSSHEGHIYQGLQGPSYDQGWSIQKQYLCLVFDPVVTSVLRVLGAERLFSRLISPKVPALCCHKCLKYKLALDGKDKDILLLIINARSENMNLGEK